LKSRTKPTINKEFKIPNHVAGTSVDSAAYSLLPYYNTPYYDETRDKDSLEHTFESLFKQFDQNISNNNQRYYSQ
jgi:hypothetical protein